MDRAILAKASEPLRRLFESHDITVRNDIARAFAAMQQHQGIIGGVIGKDTRITQAFIDVCKQIRKPGEACNILWIVPPSYQGATTHLVRQHNEIAGSIFVATSDTIERMSISRKNMWSLLILQHLDTLLEQLGNSRVLSDVRRESTVFSLDAFDHQSIGSVVQTLHLPPEATPLLAQCTLAPRIPAKATPVVTVESTPTTHRPAVPTPPPASQSRRGSIPPLAQVPHQSNVRPQIAISFWEQARAWQDREAPFCTYVPFNAGQPTYTDMSPAQQQWYFYWRSLARRHTMVPTDDAYIFLNIYETLAGIGFSSIQKAFDHLMNLWDAYAQDHSAVRRSLITWIADFTAVHPVTFKPMAWYNHVQEIGLDSQHEFLLIADAWRRSGENWLKFPTILLENFIYPVLRRRFHWKYNLTAQTDEKYKRALFAIDEYLLRTTARSLLYHICPADPIVVERRPFADSPCENPSMPPVTFSVHAAFSQQKLNETVLNIIETADFMLRQHYQSQVVWDYRSPLPADWQKVIQTAMDTMIRAESLSTTQVRAAIVPSDSSPRSSSPSGPLEAPTKRSGSDAVTDMASSGTIRLPARPVRRVTKPDVHISPASHSSPKPGQTPPSPGIAQSPATKIPAQLSLDDDLTARYYEESLATTERLGVDDTGSFPVIRPDIVVAPAEPVQITHHVLPETLDSAWSLAAEQWTAAHWSLLIALTYDDADARAVAVAQSGKPLSLLLDQINAIAQEAIDENVIDPDSGAICEEYQDDILILCDWYMEAQAHD